MPITDTVEPWCHEATRDNIRHYAHGIGDDNPLWCDPDYAARHALGRHHRAAELRVRDQPDHVGLRRRPARHPRHVGGRRLDLAHDRCGATTRSRTEAWLKDLIEHQTRFAGRSIQQIYHVDFFNQHGDLVADADSWCFRTERDHGARDRARSTRR